MTEALTYDSLVSDIQTYAERSDDSFVAQIPRFIMLAENRLASEAKGLGLLKFANFNLGQGATSFVKPSRWRETKHIFINGSSGIVWLYSRGYPYCKTYWPDSSVQDEPKYYADYDYEHFLVVPTPDADYTGEIAYYERPEPLSDTNQTNWITQYAPQLLLYACLLEAQPYLKNSERISEFQGLYDRALSGLKNEDTARLSDAASNRGNG